MNAAVRTHLIKYNESQGWGLIETLIESDIIWEEKKSSQRWWDNYFSVVNVDGMLIGFIRAVSTGDASPKDMGWEMDTDSICEVISKEVMIRIYEPKS